MSPETALAIDLLRDYLDRVGFQQLYKFIVGMNLYGAAPSMIARNTAAEVAKFFDTVLPERKDLRLLQCLMMGRDVAVANLTDGESAVFEAMLAAGLIEAREEGRIASAGEFQLISAFGMDLLIDRRIHFGGDMHQVYIGPDSYALLYYVETLGLQRQHRVVDLCTGSGIGALYLSTFSEYVLATDIGSAPLRLVQLNRRLNRREERVEIREQDLRLTLDGREKFDLLVCNPPFVAFPQGVNATLYSQGPDVDGLGYMRIIIESLPSVLNPGGCAYLVADMVGDKSGPYFLQELEKYAAAEALEVDVYIDHRIDAELQVDPLSQYLERINPGRHREEIATQFRDFQRETLRAERYYMSTVRLKAGGGEPGVRVMRRYALPKKCEETWPMLLLQE